MNIIRETVILCRSWTWNSVNVKFVRFHVRLGKKCLRKYFGMLAKKQKKKNVVNIDIQSEYISIYKMICSIGNVLTDFSLSVFEIGPKFYILSIRMSNSIYALLYTIAQRSNQWWFSNAKSYLDSIFIITTNIFNDCLLLFFYCYSCCYFGLSLNVWISV